MPVLDDLREKAKAGRQKKQKKDELLEQAAQQARSVEKNPISLIFVTENDAFSITEQIIKHCRLIERKGLVTIEQYLLNEDVIRYIVELAQTTKVIVATMMSPDMLANSLSDNLFYQIYPLYQADSRGVHIVTIRAKDCDYSESPYSILLYIPRDRAGKDYPIERWTNRDQACYKTSEEIKSIVNHMMQ